MASRIKEQGRSQPEPGGHARTIARSTIGRAILQIVACAMPGVNAIACAAVGAGLTLAAGGSIKQALIGAAISFAQMGAYGFIHGTIAGIADGAMRGIVKIGLHAVVGGAVAMAQGGSFASGAFTGAISAGSSLAMDESGVMGHSGDEDAGNIAARTAVAAIAGGTASILSGGKFANGAITGAFAQLYNGEGGGCGIVQSTMGIPGLCSGPSDIGGGGGADKRTPRTEVDEFGHYYRWRPLNSDDVGLKSGKIEGNIYVADGKTAYANIDLIEGKIENPATFLDAMKNAARGLGATDELVIDASIANPKIINIAPRYGVTVESSFGKETFRIPLVK